MRHLHACADGLAFRCVASADDAGSMLRDFFTLARAELDADVR